MNQKIKTVLAISASDSSGGAGMQADVRVISACGLWPLSVITAITAQNSRGVSSVFPLSPEIVESQFMAVLNEVRPDAIKIGVTGSTSNLILISELIRKYLPGIPVVVDPVVTASSGGELSESPAEMMDAYINHLFPINTLLTPNIPETEKFLLLLRQRHHISHSPERLPESSAELFMELSGVNGMVIKGGHSKDSMVTDLLISRKAGHYIYSKYEAETIDGANFHGTGCVYSSLLASALAKGETEEGAFLFASSTIHNMIKENAMRIFPNPHYPPLL